MTRAASRAGEEGDRAGAAQKGGGQREVAAILDDLRGRDRGEILTTKQVIELTGVTQTTIFNWIRRKESPLLASKPGREWQIKVGDLHDFLVAKAYREGELREASADVRTHAAAHLEAVLPPPFSVLQFVPPAGEAEGGTKGEGEASNASLNSAEVIARLIDLAGIGLQWRRAMLTLGTARRDQDEGWVVECEATVARLEGDMLRACGFVGERGLALFRYAADEAVAEAGSAQAEVAPAVTGEDNPDAAVAGWAPTAEARAEDEEFGRMVEILSGVYKRWSEGRGVAGQDGPRD